MLPRSWLILLSLFSTPVPCLTHNPLAHEAHVAVNSSIPSPHPPSNFSAYETDKSSLPVVRLPHGHHRASSYDPVTQIYRFSNIRYAAPPTGERRWAKPVPPAWEPGVHDGKDGALCIQAPVPGRALEDYSLWRRILGKATEAFAGFMNLPWRVPPKEQSEDCLFLDVYVPKKALQRRDRPLPVVVWIHGGAFLLGGKDQRLPGLPVYDGSGLIVAAEGDMIFVSINYRLGAFGFLAGTSMERDGLPNAGLWDQRAALEWVQENIRQLGGNPGDVTAMGQSAGASSILHHLVAFGGNTKLLFNKVAIFSTAYKWMWDRAGLLEDTFQEFASMVGCKGGGVSCLRNARESDLVKANLALAKKSTTFEIPVGPSVDGSLIRQLPVLELAAGHWSRPTSMLVSHTSGEGKSFVNDVIRTQKQFVELVHQLFPRYTVANGLLDKITSFYPREKGVVQESTATKHLLERFASESGITCSDRYLAEAMPASLIWNMQWSVWKGRHASDLAGIFYSQTFQVSVNNPLLTAAWKVLQSLFYKKAPAYQSYLASFVTTGDPNTLRQKTETIEWPHPDSRREHISGVLDVAIIGIWRSKGYKTVSDTRNPRRSCDFWRDFAAAATISGGYAPPGEPLKTSMIDAGAYNASANYVGGNRL